MSHDGKVIQHYAHVPNPTHTHTHTHTQSYRGEHAVGGDTAGEPERGVFTRLVGLEYVEKSTVGVSLYLRLTLTDSSIEYPKDGV